MSTPGLVIPVDLNISVTGLAEIQQEVKSKIAAINAEVARAAATTTPYRPQDVRATYRELGAQTQAAAAGLPYGVTDPLLRKVGVAGAAAYTTAGGLHIPGSVGQKLTDQDAEVKGAVSKRVKALEESTLHIQQQSDTESTQGQAFIEAKTLNIEALHQLAATLETELASRGVVVEADTALSVAKQQMAAQTRAGANAQLAADEEYVVATVAAAEAQAQKAAKQTLLSAANSLPEAQSELANQYRVAAASLEGESLLERASMAKKITAQARAAAAVEAMTAEEISLSLQSRSIQATAQNVQRRAVVAQLRQQALSGDLGGTFFQRLQTRFSASGKLPTENPTFGQAVGTKTLTTLGYGIAGGAVFGAAFGIAKLIKDAELLQQALSRLDAQLTAAGKGDRFAEVRKSIISISEETGAATTDVATASARLIGAFGDVDTGLTATAESMKLMVLTGNDLETTLQDSVAVSKAFGVSVGQMGDIVVDVAERTGVAAGSLEKFLGQTAAVAAEAGLSLRDTAVIGAHAAQQLGRAPDQEAGTFDRVLAQIGQYKENILALYATTPALAKNLNTVANAFAQGKSGDALKQFVADFNQLSKAQQTDVIAQVGGKKGAAYLTGLLQDSESLTAELNASDTSAGKLDERFASIQDTLKNIGQRLHAVFRELGDALLNAGLADIFGGIAVAIGGVVKAVIGLLNGFHAIDEATKPILNFFGNLATFGKLGDVFPGFLSTFAEIAIVAALATKAINFARAAFEGFGKAGAEQAQASAKNETTAATVRKTEALAAESEANVANTGAISSNVVAEERQAVAKIQGSVAAAQAAAAQGVSTAATESQIGAEGVSFLPSRGQRIAGATLGSGLGAKLFSGGTVLKSGAADAAAGEAAGASGAGIAGLVAAGVIAVGQSYLSNKGDREKQSEDLAAKVKGQDADKLRRIKAAYEANESVYDRFSVAIFGSVGPADRLADEIARSDAKGGIQLINGAQQKGKLDELVKKIDDANLGRIQGIFNTNDESKKAFQEAGGQLSESAADRAKNVLALIPGVQDSKGQVENLTRDQLTAVLPKLKDAADKGDQNAAKAVGEIEKVLRGQAGLQSLVSELAGSGKTKEAIDAAGGVGGFLSLTQDQAKAELDSGKISSTAYLATVRQRLSEAQRANDGTPDSKKALDKGEADFAKARNERVKALAAQAAALASAKGADPIDTDLTRLQSIVNSPDNTGADKLAQLPELLAKEKEKTKQQIELLGDPAEQLRIAREGVTNSPELQKLLVASQLNTNQGTSVDLTDLANGLGVFYDNLLIQVSGDLVETGKSVQELEIEAATKGIAELDAKINSGDLGYIDKAQAVARRSQLESVRNRISASTDGKTKSYQPSDFKDRKLSPDEQHAAVQAATSNYKAIADVVKASVEGNPLLAVQTTIAELEQELQLVKSDPKAKPEAAQALEAQIIRANRQAADITHDIMRANLELVLGVARNPVANAQNQLILAQFDQAVAAAKGDPAAIQRSNLAVQSAQFGVIDAQADTARAQLEAAGAGERDPVAQAKRALVLAQYDQAVARSKGDTAGVLRSGIQIVAAQQQIADAENERIKAQLQLESAKTLDPVEQARIAQQLADNAAANAHSVADEIAAQAQRVSADRQMHDAILAITESQAGLIIAIADAAGDTVGSANAQLAEARRKLAEAISSGAGTAAVNQAQIEVVKQQANVRDAQFSKSLGDIEFAASVEEITTAQEIQMLEALASVPGHTEEQMRSIRQKIFELKKEVSKDFQFNLPTLDLSGLFYQANRVIQTQAAGIGYQDNRNNNIQISINGAQDPNLVGAAVARAIGGPSNGGALFAPGPRRTP